MPDSCDNWGLCYPEEDFEPPDIVEERLEQYHVMADWVYDGEAEGFNEWMNEEDYEVEDNGKIKAPKVNAIILSQPIVVEFLSFLTKISNFWHVECKMG